MTSILCTVTWWLSWPQNAPLEQKDQVMMVQAMESQLALQGLSTGERRISVLPYANLHIRATK